MQVARDHNGCSSLFAGECKTINRAHRLRAGQTKLILDCSPFLSKCGVVQGSILYSVLLPALYFCIVPLGMFFRISGLRSPV